MAKLLTYDEINLLQEVMIDGLSHRMWVDYHGNPFLLFDYGCGRFGLIQSPVLSHTLGVNPLTKELRPYLYPLSSITEEDLNGLAEICGTVAYLPESDKLVFESTSHDIIIKGLNFLKDRQYDLYGLTKKGLAIDPTGKEVEQQPFWHSFC